SVVSSQGSMATTSCPRCGGSLPDNARFCGQCGLVVGPTAPTPAAGEQAPPRISPKTVVQFASTPRAPESSPTPPAQPPKPDFTRTFVDPEPAGAAAGPPAAPAPSSRAADKRTMLGIAASDVLPPELRAPAPALTPQPPQQQVPQGGGPGPQRMGTML